MAETDRFLATVADGAAPVVVHRSRDRRYPGLASPAPATNGVYRAATRALAASTSVLDVGSGAGVGAAQLESAGRTVTGVDPSDEAVAFARLYAPSARYVLGELDALEPGAAFDGVTIVDVLGLIAEPHSLLAAARERATPAAPFIVAEPRATLDQQLAAPARRAFTREALEALLVCGGLVGAPLVAAPAEFVSMLARPARTRAAADALAQADACVPGDAAAVVSAMTAVERALEGAADPVEARELLLAYGALHLRQRDLDSAAGTFVGVLRMAPDCARAQLGLGRVAEAVGRPTDALRLYEKASRSDPFDADVWTAIGTLHARRGNAGPAADALARAVRLSPAEARVVDAFATVGDAAEPSAVANAREALATYQRATSQTA